MSKKKVQFVEGSLEKSLDLEAALPRGYLSWSQVSSVLRCPRAYQLRYIDGKTITPPARMAEGKAVHRGLEVGHREQKKVGKVPHLDIYLDSWRDSWHANSKEIGQWDGENASIIEKRDRLFLTDYHTSRAPKLHPVAIEERFHTMLGEVPILGFIDLIDAGKGGKTVVDSKVISRMKSEADVANDGQLTLYSKVTGISQVRFDCFVKLKKAPVIKTISSTRTPSDYTWIEHIFCEVAKLIGRGIFPPCDPSGWNCSEKWCGFWPICRGKKR